MSHTCLTGPQETISQTFSALSRTGSPAPATLTAAYQLVAAQRACTLDNKDVLVLIRGVPPRQGPEQHCPTRTPRPAQVPQLSGQTLAAVVLLNAVQSCVDRDARVPVTNCATKCLHCYAWEPSATQVCDGLGQASACESQTLMSFS